MSCNKRKKYLGQYEATSDSQGHWPVSKYFYIRYLCGILNVSLGDCEMDAKYDYTPIAMADDLIDLDDDDRKHIINHICNFLHWKLPPGDVDSISC